MCLHDLTLKCFSSISFYLSLLYHLKLNTLAFSQSLTLAYSCLQEFLHNCLLSPVFLSSFFSVELPTQFCFVFYLNYVISCMKPSLSSLSDLSITSSYNTILYFLSLLDPCLSSLTSL